MRAWWVAGLAVLVAGCFPYPKKDEGADAGVDAGVEVDAGNPPGGNLGGPGDGGELEKPETPIPPVGSPDGGSGTGTGTGTRGPIPGTTAQSPTGVVFLFRVDRSAANLAAEYEELTFEVEAALTDSGFVVGAVAAGSLYDGTLFWTKNPTHSLRDAVSRAASFAPAAMPTECSTNRAASLLSLLSQSEVRWPDYGPQGVKPFHQASGALLVVIVDHGDRPRAWGDPQCEPWGTGISPAEYFSHPNWWLNSRYRNWNLAPEQTRFFVVHTSESTSYADYRAACSSFGVSGYRLDAVEPSELAYYGQFVDGLNAFRPGQAEEADLCAAIGLPTFEDHVAEAAAQWKVKLEAYRP